MYFFSERSKNRMDGVDERLIEVFDEAIKISPIDFGIPRDGGLRTAERQNAMFLDPMIKTRCDGYKNPSPHQTGKALDFYAYVNGAASWEKVHLAMVAAVIISVGNSKGYDIRWGGTFGSSDFNGWDYPHVEILGGL